VEDRIGVIERLKLWLKPPRLHDPDFGLLRFMYISNAPEKSYWEADWKFPPLGYDVSIGLPGDQAGPTAEARAFFLSRVTEFERILGLVRPQLDAVFRQWLSRPLGEDMWAFLKLGGFNVENPARTPVEWSVSFETVGERWLGITVPLIGDEAQAAEVDT
jgi:hypothetical protein